MLDGRYEITRAIGAGGMGQVLLGYDTVLDREVAVKRIAVRPFATAPDLVDEFTARFRREARVTARIRHHGVPQVYDAVLDADATSVYLVMERIDGITLRDFLAIGPPPIATGVAIAAQIATVLSHAHVLPVVHRDLKPANVIVAADGTVKVIDFGIAALLDDSASRITRTGSVLGTAAYMSPELANGQPVGPRADLYALGCIMHEIFTGSTVFHARGEYATHRQHSYDAPTPLRAMRPDVPAPIEALVLELLAKTPGDRPASAAVVYERLLPFLPPPGAPEPPALAGYPDPTLVFRRPNPPATPPDVTQTGTRPRARVHAESPPDTARFVEAAAEYRRLFDLGRFAQAAEALLSIADEAAARFGADSAEVAELHHDIALAFANGGEQRKALGQWELAEAVAVRGSGTEYRRRANLGAIKARAALGDLTASAAVDELYSLFGDLRGTDEEFGDEAIDVRLAIAELLPATGDHARAERFVSQLVDDLAILRAPDDAGRRLAEQIAAELRG
ncbi:serine/threonine-protein kinase [Nocardia camponoti]|uniref:serine/threonine-protein kinase n=1 Tax=Nocardia camponoti TaxID=1616106 RepID=UPI00166E5EF1|nr:serine/threonine-protein kinase [Nocardia camponoti]